MTSAMNKDRKSTRLNSSHTEIYTLSLHDALPISFNKQEPFIKKISELLALGGFAIIGDPYIDDFSNEQRSEEHTSELQSHRDLHSFPTRRSSDLIQQTRTIH